jgi:hypothetical protein
MNIPLGSLAQCAFGEVHSYSDIEVYTLSSVYEENETYWQIVGDMEGEIFIVEACWLHLVKTRATALKQAEALLEEHMTAYEHHYYN